MPPRFALNGAAAIHDFEIAIAGHTSEDVEAVLPDGSFGAAEETGREFNAALNCEQGFGESLGHHLENNRRPALRRLQPVVRGLSQLHSGHRTRRHRNGYAAHPSHRSAATL